MHLKTQDQLKRAFRVQGAIIAEDWPRKLGTIISGLFIINP